MNPIVGKTSPIYNQENYAPATNIPITHETNTLVIGDNNVVGKEIKSTSPIIISPNLRVLPTGEGENPNGGHESHLGITSPGPLTFETVSNDASKSQSLVTDIHTMDNMQPSVPPVEAPSLKPAPLKTSDLSSTHKSIQANPVLKEVREAQDKSSIGLNPTDLENCERVTLPSLEISVKEQAAPSFHQNEPVQFHDMQTNQTKTSELLRKGPLPANLSQTKLIPLAPTFKDDDQLAEESQKKLIPLAPKVSIPVILMTPPNQSTVESKTSQHFLTSGIPQIENREEEAKVTSVIETATKSEADLRTSIPRVQHVYIHEKTKWDIMFDYLCQYKEIHGDCLVPNRYKPLPQLGSWVSTQRRHYKAMLEGTQTPLTQERVRLLKEIGFTWATRDPRHVPWELRYSELQDYKKQHGDCLVPVGYKPNPQLSNWVSTQRQEWKIRKKNGTSRLTEEKIIKLNQIGFVWEAQRGGARKRKKNILDTKELKQSTKRTINSELGLRISNEKEGIDAKDTSKVVWNTPLTKPPVESQAKWNNMLIELLAYRARHGHSNVPRICDENPELGRWVALQRQRYLEQKINPMGPQSLETDKISRLNDIGFVWCDSCNHGKVEHETINNIGTSMVSTNAMDDDDIFADASDDEENCITKLMFTKKTVDLTEQEQSSNKNISKDSALEIVRAEAAVTLLSLLKDGTS